MKRIVFMFALLPALLAAGNLLTTPAVEWKRDFRPGNRKDIYDVKAVGSEGAVRVRRFASSVFGRMYHDMKLKPGASFRLDYTQNTESGVLTKMLIIFKGGDGQWREKTRLSFFTPLVNGGDAVSSVKFTVPEDAVETRIDYRIDSFGTVELKNISLTELSGEEAEAFRKSQEVRAFTPGSGGDYALQPGGYYRVSFTGRKQGGQPGELKMRFHYPEKGFHRDGHISFFLRGDDPAAREEIIVIPDEAEGCRVEIAGAEIRDLKFELQETK